MAYTDYPFNSEVMGERSCDSRRFCGHAEVLSGSQSVAYSAPCRTYPTICMCISFCGEAACTVSYSQITVSPHLQCLLDALN